MIHRKILDVDRALWLHEHALHILGSEVYLALDAEQRGVRDGSAK